MLEFILAHAWPRRTGDVHKRQRKVMLPAFGAPESKALLPVFRHYAEQVRIIGRIVAVFQCCG